MAKAKKKNSSSGGLFGDMYPYQGRYEAFTTMPPQGRAREQILRQLKKIAKEENANWQTGQISGTYYHGGMEHYAFLNKVFGLFSHVNLLQRDLCPSGTKFEGEVITMTARMLNADAA